MQAQGVRLTMSQVTKRFGDVIACQDVDLAINHGEVHAIVGENGAGKSTLMRVLAGHHAADAGAMVFEGAPIQIGRATPGQRTGIGFVEQEGGLIGELTGSENLILAERRGLWSSRNEASIRIKELARKFGSNVDPDVPVQMLPMGQQQRIEILIAFARGAKVLILDEPTASLAIEDARLLGQIIRKFVNDGGSIFYISHKLNEVREVADTVTVMRRGRVVGRHSSDAVSVGQLAAEMVGEALVVEKEGDLLDVALGSRATAHRASTSRQVCALRNVSAPSSYRSDSDLVDVDLVVREGEIVGVAGVIGSGQTTLAEVLAGLKPVQRGMIERRQGAVAYAPENRHRDALALSLTLRDNLMVHFHRRGEFASGLRFRRNAIDRHVDFILASSRVHGGRRDAPASSLSGGNQQKLVLGRELEQKPSLVIAHNPFRGLDVRAIRDVRDALLGACEAGAGVVMISPDLDELFQLSHRIVVLFGGSTIGEVDANPEQVEAVGKLMGGLS